MKHDEEDRPLPLPKVYKITGIIVAAALPFYLFKVFGVANFFAFIAISFFLHNLYGFKVLRRFQSHALPAMMRKYENLLKWVFIREAPRISALGHDWFVCIYNGSEQYC